MALFGKSSRSAHAAGGRSSKSRGQAARMPQADEQVAANDAVSEPDRSTHVFRVSTRRAMSTSVVTLQVRRVVSARRKRVRQTRYRPPACPRLPKPLAPTPTLRSTRTRSKTSAPLSSRCATSRRCTPRSPTGLRSPISRLISARVSSSSSLVIPVRASQPSFACSTASCAHEWRARRRWRELAHHQELAHPVPAS